MLEVLPQIEIVDVEGLSGEEKRMLQMFHFTIWQKSIEDCGFSSIKEGLLQIKNSPVLFAELQEILRY